MFAENRDLSYVNLHMERCRGRPTKRGSSGYITPDEWAAVMIGGTVLLIAIMLWLLLR
jgi:hypothetical protein